MLNVVNFMVRIRLELQEARPTATGLQQRGGEQMEDQLDENPDHDLIARTIGGDESAFDQLYRRHRDDVWKLAYHMLQDRPEAEEVVQDTFVKALHALPGFRGDCPFRAFLLSICRNRCRDALEKMMRKDATHVSFNSRDPNLDSDAHEPFVAGIAWSPDPETQWTTRLDLAAALARLPVDQREAFVLIAVMQKTAEEAAKILGCPRTTLQSRLGGARAKLAARLEGYS